MDARHASGGIGDEAQHLGFVVHQQGVRPGVVGFEGLAIKGGRIMPADLKGTAVDHDVARNRLHAHPLQAAQHQPQALGHQLGVARTLDVDRAAQRAVIQHPVQIHRRAPHIGRAQLLQRRIGGHQLHDRGRIHRAGALPRQPHGLAPFHRRDIHRHGIAGNLRPRQRSLHRRRQRLRHHTARTGQRCADHTLAQTAPPHSLEHSGQV